MGVGPIYRPARAEHCLLHLQGLRTSHEIMRVIKISHERLFFAIRMTYIHNLLICFFYYAYYGIDNFIRTLCLVINNVKFID